MAEGDATAAKDELPLLELTCNGGPVAVKSVCHKCGGSGLCIYPAPDVNTYDKCHVCDGLGWEAVTILPFTNRVIFPEAKRVRVGCDEKHREVYMPYEEFLKRE